MNPLFKKLNYKAPSPIVVVNAPPSFVPALDEMKAEADVFTSVAGEIKTGFAMAFVTKQKEIMDIAPIVTGRLEADGVLWFCYPKGTSKKYTCDFNRDTGWEPLGKLGFEPVRQVAIDEDWSALRFRRVAFIRNMSRQFSMTDEGKKKATAGRKK